MTQTPTPADSDDSTLLGLDLLGAAMLIFVPLVAVLVVSLLSTPIVVPLVFFTRVGAHQLLVTAVLYLCGMIVGTAVMDRELLGIRIVRLRSIVAVAGPHIASIMVLHAWGSVMPAVVVASLSCAFLGLIPLLYGLLNRTSLQHHRASRRSATIASQTTAWQAAPAPTQAPQEGVTFDQWNR